MEDKDIEEYHNIGKPIKLNRKLLKGEKNLKDSMI